MNFTWNFEIFYLESQNQSILGKILPNLDQTVQIISFSLQCQKILFFLILSSPKYEISKPFDKSKLESQNQSTFAKIGPKLDPNHGPFFHRISNFWSGGSKSLHFSKIESNIDQMRTKLGQQCLESFHLAYRANLDYFLHFLKA